MNEPYEKRWRIAWLLGFGVLVNYFDRVNLSVSQAALVTTFGISSVTFGYLSSAYNWTYALCQLPVGVVLDRYGVRRVGRVSTFLWSVASFAAAITPRLGGLFAARFLLGIGESPTFPGNAKAIGLWFPPKERTLSTAMFDAAAKLAPAIGIPTIGFLLLRIGWRWSFAVTGLVSLIYFGCFYGLYHDPVDPQASESDGRALLQDVTVEEEESEKDRRRYPLLYLLKQRKVLGLAIGFGSYNYVFYLLLTWLPSYLSSALKIDLLHSFLYTGVPWLFATFTDIVVGGWLADRLIGRGWDARKVRKAILVGGTTFGLGILGAGYAHSPVQALLWISISIGGLAAAAPVGWSLPSFIVPPSSVGSVSGIINFSNQISGIAAPIITGYIVFHMHSFTWAFVVATGYLVLGIASYLILLGKIDRISGPAEDLLVQD